MSPGLKRFISTVLSCFAATHFAALSYSEAFAETRAANNLRRSGIAEKTAPKTAATPANRGWGYLVDKLAADGFDRATLNSIYGDKRLPPFKDVYFNLQPKEAHSIYNGFKKDAQIRKAQIFIAENRTHFGRVEKKFAVSRYVIAGILLIETQFGKNTGKESVLNRLSRVGAIGEPDNLQLNYLKHSKQDPKVTLEDVKNRAKFLEDRFYPEIKALFEICKKNRIDPIGVKGSSAGAFGIPQFLPSTYLKYGVDGNLDGKISLYDIQDAISSTANFLHEHGWQDEAVRKDKEAVIWNYNHSEAYVHAVLDVAAILKSRSQSP